MSREKPTVWTGAKLGLVSALLTGIAIVVAIVAGAPIEIAAVLGAIISFAMYSYLQRRD